jgi:hypothetical protein
MSAEVSNGVERRIVQRYGCRVLDGPFAGMAYVAEAVGLAFVPKLLGAYERGLHPSPVALEDAPTASG